MLNIINFTSMRKGRRVNGLIIDYCPECGQKGQRVGTRFIHRVESFELFCWEVVKRTECRGKYENASKDDRDKMFKYR